MKRSELREIIRGVIKQTLKEFMTSGALIGQSPQGTGQEQEFDPSQPHPDDESPIEKAKQHRELEKQRRDKVKQTDMDLKITKDQTKYFDSQVKKNKLDTTNKQKELQQLKGAKI